MPARKELSYRITVQDLHDLIENVETLLGVRVTFQMEVRLSPKGTADLIWVACKQQQVGGELADGLASYKERAIKEGDFDVVHICYDLLWDAVKDLQNEFPF